MNAACLYSSSVTLYNNNQKLILQQLYRPLSVGGAQMGKPVRKPRLFTSPRRTTPSSPRATPTSAYNDFSQQYYQNRKFKRIFAFAREFCAHVKSRALKSFRGAVSLQQPFVYIFSPKNMGAYLAKPKTEKISDANKNGRLRYGVSCMQGWRVTMEVKFTKRFHSSKTNCVCFAI